MAAPCDSISTAGLELGQTGAQPAKKSFGAKSRASTPGAPTGRNVNVIASQTQTPRQGAAGKPPTMTPHTSGMTGLDEDMLRAGFLRKVYALLTVQLMVTVAISTMCMFTPIIRDTLARVAVSQTWWLKWAQFLPVPASLLALHCAKEGKYPSNYIFLSIFTLIMSGQIAYVCSVFQTLGYGYLILQAFAAATVVFSGLTVYTLVSGKDFSYMGGFLAMMLWGLVLTGLARVVFPGLFQGLAYGCIGALTFCGYILFDTWRIQKQFSYDDYIGATIELYLDFLNLFLYILDILQSCEKRKKSS